MKRYYTKARALIFSSTARDTYVLFGGNVISAFLGFIYTLVIARTLDVPNFGIFSAATNLVVILHSITDLGISSGAVNFIAESNAKSDEETGSKYIKASLILRFAITFIVAFLVIIFSKYIANTFLVTENTNIAILTAIVSLSLAVPMLFPFFLQAKKKFVPSIISDISLYLSRLVFTFSVMLLTKVTVENSLIAFVVGGIVGTVVGAYLIKFDFLKSKPEKQIYEKLIRFSGWIGVNRIISSLSGRLDIQMLAVMSGATATGLYSIPSRLAGFIIVLTSSLSGVLASRLAGFGNKDKEKKYILKATLALIPITMGIIVWAIIAKPFILLLFGENYLDSVPVFRALVLSMIPFIFTAPSVAAIIYAMKKNIYIGIYSFFQLAAIFLLNLFFIPKYGPLGPTFTFGITNTILAIYTWAIVIRHYWSK